MAKNDAKKRDDKKLFAFLGVFLTVIGFILVLATRKDDKYSMFYAKQGLVLFIAGVIVQIASLILLPIPIVGWIVISFSYVMIIALWIIGMMYSLSGEMKEIPLIGRYARNIKL